MNQEHLEQAFDREFTESQDNFKASCPFHDERTPSFYVHKTELIGNCFGCGTSGYIDTLLTRYAGVTATEARTMLDIDIIEDVVLRKRERDPGPPKVFPESWLAPFEKKVHKYILERGYEITVLRSIGTLYDPVRNRQVFPHRRGREDLVGAVGRACRGQEPKWYFYWDYRRGQTLYRPWTNGQRKAIVGEGVFELVKLKQAGVEDYDLVSPIGTKLGPGQVRELKEYDEVIIAFDNDLNSSGKEGAEKLYTRLRKSCIVKFAITPDEWNDIGEMPEEKAREVVETPLSYIAWKSRV